MSDPQPTQRQKSTHKWTFHHVNAFLLTFWGYALYHSTRKSFSNVKQTISEEWCPGFHNESVPMPKPSQKWDNRHLFKDTESAETFLGVLDTVFLVAYSIGLYISGIIGDRFDMRKVLSIGMCGAAVCVFMFGCVSEWLHIYNKAYYITFWILNGFLQSSGWPAMVAVMANWFGESSRGFVLGIWSACASVGNIVGSGLASSVIDYGYEYVFLVCSATLFGGGIIIFFGLVTHPHHVGLPSPRDEDKEQQDVTESEPLLDNEEDINQDNSEIDEAQVEVQSLAQKSKGIGFFQAVLIPGVIPYSLSYACLKLVNYSFFFWLPFYLTNKYHWDQSAADKISIWYDVGGIIGGALAGFISDRVGMRGVVCSFMLLLSLPALFVYSESPKDIVINSLFMAITGFWIGGPANLISSAISADLGQKGSLQNTEALATVTGIVDGTGSFGGALGQILIPIIQTHYNWSFVFYLFMIMSFLTFLCILPISLQEIRSTRCWIWCRNRHNSSQESSIQDNSAST